MINDQTKIPCKPFKNNHEEQLKLAKSFDWLDFSLLQDIEEEFREIVRASIFIDQSRCDAICLGAKERVKTLKDFANGQTIQNRTDDTKYDVKQDRAYNGIN